MPKANAKTVPNIFPAMAEEAACRMAALVKICEVRPRQAIIVNGLHRYAATRIVRSGLTNRGDERDSREAMREILHALRRSRPANTTGCGRICRIVRRRGA